MRMSGRRAIQGTLAAISAAGLLAALFAAGASSHAENAPDTIAGPAEVNFVRDIQPIFAENCLKCHDGVKHKGGMRLDSKATAFIGGDSGDPSIVPHDISKSKLIQLVRGDDPSAVMPPKGKRLSTAQIDLLVRWVKQGAQWPDGVDRPSAVLAHWSFNKPVRPNLPPVKNSQWVRNPIDAFVLAKLEQNGMQPSHEADRYTLIRRLSFDLIGLPPTPHEVQEFVSDKSPDAYEKLVDRLQASPHYGEKWARQWLDLGRYADSAGYGSDPLRYTTFRWRDWLIDALNQNKPYDQFTIEQIAGDLLPHPTTEQLIATAFNRNTMTNTEGGTDPEEYRNEAVKDRTDTTIQVWMGLTMGCAKCHTHKYDPITNREYYQVFSFFNQTEDANRADESPTIPTPTPEQAARIAAINQKIEKAQARLANPEEWTAAQRAWEKTLGAIHSNWVVLNPSQVNAESGATMTVQPDGSVLASGKLPRTETYTVTTHCDLANITGFRIEVLPDPSLPGGGPGRNSKGSFVLNDFRVAIAPAESKPIHGRFLRIDLPGHEKILSLAEVQIFHGAENIARQGKATQSSTDFDGKPELAIDGVTDGDFEAHKTSHTAKSNDPWWEVDLGQSSALDKVVLWNRTDSELQSRLSEFNVSVLDDDRKVVWTTHVATAPDPSMQIKLGAPPAIALKQATDSFHQTIGGDWTAAKVLKGDHTAGSGWAISPAVGKPHEAVFETAQDVNITAGGTLTFTLVQKFPEGPIGRFRISATSDPRPVRVLPESVTEALASPVESRSAADKKALFDYFIATAPEPRVGRDQIAELNKELADVKPAMTAIMRELPPDKQREDHVLVKGNFLSKGPVVTPAVPAAFNPFPKDAPHNRLGLAEWIMARDNPLTARVEVNRIWGQLFGEGIVQTQEDFGTQGRAPSDQPLLDWLAVEFMEPSESSVHPWDMKRITKLMVMSAAFRQASRATPEILEKDPDDALISRGSSKRLPAETVRDQALALSGLLSEKMEGPSVFPPQPDGLWQVAFNGEHTWATSTGEDRYRRGIYVFWRRTIPYPSMSAFDAPSREVCTVRRIQTSTPLQAFVTLNDPVYVECSQALARRIMLEGGVTDADRAKFALELCLCRPAESRQIERLIALHVRELEHYLHDEKSAIQMATSERGPLPKGISVDDAAAWTVCANILLNMDGVLSKR
jgi:mono/diheme cytochrome c family protein